MHPPSRPGDGGQPATLSSFWRLVPASRRRFSRTNSTNRRNVNFVFLFLAGAVYGVIVFGLNVSAADKFVPLVFRSSAVEEPSRQGGGSDLESEHMPQDGANFPPDSLGTSKGTMGGIVSDTDVVFRSIDKSVDHLRVLDGEDSAVLEEDSNEASVSSSADQPDPVTAFTTRLSKDKLGDIPSDVAIDVVFYGLHREGPCTDGWRSKACYDNIVRFASDRQQNGTIILVVAARSSYDVMLNWCISMKRVGLDNYILVALDNDAQEFFSEKGAPVVQLPRGPGEEKVSKSDVWVQRTFVAHMILSEGIDVLISDADAVMMKSPFENPLSHFDDKSFDIITTPSNFPNPSKGELPDACPSPPPGKMEWRHWPCMGWTLLRASKRMYIFFVEEFLRDVIRYQDDQIGFNCAIRKAGAEWNEGSSWTTNKTVRIKAKTPKLKLLMLPAAQFVRNCTDFKEEKDRGYGIYKFDPSLVQLYHCKGHNKRQNAQNNDFWFVKHDWESVTPDPDSYSSYLSLISTSR